MPTDAINLIGAGGQAAVVIDALLAEGVKPDAVQVWTQDSAATDSTLLGLEIRHLINPALLSGQAVHICIGDNAARQRVSRILIAVGAVLRTVTHPRATISAHAIIGPGSFVGAGSIVATRTRIGVGAIINHNAVVDHDCILGDFVHVAPGATLGGAVKVADLVLIGAGVNILPACNVGLGAVVGAGAVVTSDITEGATYAGIPAAPLNKRRK